MVKNSVTVVLLLMSLQKLREAFQNEVMGRQLNANDHDILREADSLIKNTVIAYSLDARWVKQYRTLSEAKQHAYDECEKEHSGFSTCDELLILNNNEMWTRDKDGVWRTT